MAADVEMASTVHSKSPTTSPNTSASASVFSLSSYSYSTRVVTLVVIWFASSSVAVLLTKSLFSGTIPSLNAFPFALFVTGTNNLFAWLISAVLLLNNHNAHRHLLRDKNVRRLSLVIGGITAGEIGLSNIALSLLSVSYTTVLKGMAPLFVMSWGVVLGMQRLQWQLCTCMTLIVIGVILTVNGEMNVFDDLLSLFSGDVGAVANNEDTGKRLFGIRVSNLHVGFLFQLLSAILSGFRWILIQVFVKNEAVQIQMQSTQNSAFSLVRRSFMSFVSYINPSSSQAALNLSPIELIYCTAPYTILVLLPAIAFVEGPQLMSRSSLSTPFQTLALFGTLLGIGSSVCILLWAEYELVKLTSSLTVSVTFVLKEILVICAGKVMFNDSLALSTWLGFFIVHAGIVGYALDRRKETRKREELPLENHRLSTK